MDRIITEIIIGAIILTILISVVPIYRSSAQLVSAAGEQSDINENIREVNFGRLPVEKDYISGSYLVELIEYVKSKYNFKILLSVEDKMYVIKNDNAFDYAKINKNSIFEVSKATKNNKTLEYELKQYLPKKN